MPQKHGMLQTAFWPYCMNQASVFEWHKRFKEARESVRDDKRRGRSKEVNTPELIGQRVRVRVTIQWHFHPDNTPVHNSILVTDYLTKMGIKTVPYLPYSPDFAPCDFCLFPKFRSCCYETIEEMKEAVTKVIDTLTQEDFHGAFQELLERYNKYIAAEGDYFEGDKSFMCVLSIKVPIRKKSGNLSYAPRISSDSACTQTHTYVCVCVCVCVCGHIINSFG